MQKKQKQTQQDFVNKQRSEEGKVTINHKTGEKGKNKDNPPDGEYVDYEEIK
jgi:hypothetical protein